MKLPWWVPTLARLRRARTFEGGDRYYVVGRGPEPWVTPDQAREAVAAAAEHADEALRFIFAKSVDDAVAPPPPARP